MQVWMKVAKIKKVYTSQGRPGVRVSPQAPIAIGQLIICFAELLCMLQEISAILRLHRPYPL